MRTRSRPSKKFKRIINMREIPLDIWTLIIDEVAKLPSGSSESWSSRTSELAKVAQICKATEVSFE
jgi:hypothetical protein